MKKGTTIAAALPLAGSPQSMEYVQTVLVQIEATNIGEASRPQGLLEELDQHRSFLQHQPGFQDMRVTRSINPEGNVLLVVQTRWRDDSSLVEYETREPNVAGIINQHRDLIVADSLQVLDMEALRTEAWPGPAQAAVQVRERIALPLLVPVGVLAFMLLIIYGLSRIYLEVPSEVATPLAASIAIGILGVSWYLSGRRDIARWQLASIVLVATGLLLGGGIFAAVHEDGGAETPPAATPPPGAPGPGGPPPGGPAVGIAMVPTIKFDAEEMTLPANQEVTVRADNRDGTIIHNWAAYTDSGATEPIAKTEICTAPCVEEVKFTTPPPGEYFFRCDVHPQQMTGTLVVE